MPTPCPKCGQAAPRNSTLHASDGLWRVLFYNAYRCRACHFRFWQRNPLKPLLIVGLLALLVFIAWWIPKDPLTGNPNSADENNYNEVAARAARGDTNAELLMGLRYGDGNGVIKNEKEAARWFEKAARHGQSEAQYRYGLALLEGRGVVQNYKAAFHWIELPAKRGHSYAQYSLGELYRYGTGTTMDKAQAYLWFNLAAAQGVDKAAKARDSLAWQLKPEQLTAMQEAARHFNADDKPAGGFAAGSQATPPAAP